TRQRGMSTILITHDLGLAATYCDRVVVMEKGRVVETATSRAIFTTPSHPYTRKLMRATPRPGVALRDLLPEDGAPPPAHSPLARKIGRQRLVVEKPVKEYLRKGTAGGFKKIFERKPAAEPDTFHRRARHRRPDPAAGQCEGARRGVRALRGARPQSWLTIRS